MESHTFYESSEKKTEYYDKRSKLTRDDYFEKIDNSKTLYIGNLSPFTSEEKLYLIFSSLAPVKQITIGIHKRNFKPCGFGFVEFYDRNSTELVLRFLNKILVDGKKINLDFDIGFSEGRQYGRGYSGGQVMHEYKKSNNYYKGDRDRDGDRGRDRDRDRDRGRGDRRRDRGRDRGRDRDRGRY